MSQSMDSLPALLKIAALLTTGISVHASLSPPNPPAPPKQCIDKRTVFERCVRYVTFCSKMMVWSETTCDILATFAEAYPSLPVSPLLSRILCSSSSSSTYLLRLHPILLCGSLSTLFGAILRRSCFRTLGSLFTFELTIVPSHTLITSGPYSYVRHPSYTGIYMTLLGASAVALAPGAWLRECWLAAGRCAQGHALAAGVATITTYLGVNSSGKNMLLEDAPGTHCEGTGFGTGLAWLLLAFWTVKVVYALRSTNRRLGTEDAELHRTFGAEWETWAERCRPGQERQRRRASYGMTTALAPKCQHTESNSAWIPMFLHKRGLLGRRTPGSDRSYRRRAKVPA
ncbi:hypothetical protein A0H81_01733 [Grifola frondosa]|uniref:Protein-S-isoprenylcysteine O-methyltransferase n=1 Tax=Grifola frondosa TaxID=5627 RepID=A0A1C7MMM1_GRIFR|nr:hypothetical protein A0H81_01733 [Grifola frondosa]